MSGGYDLALTVSAKTFKDVAMFVSHRLAPLPSVQSTATHFVLRKYKEDVYKRQLLFCNNLRYKRAAKPTLTSVSYTHLDVYKRQLLQIDGVGKARAEALWKHFKTYKAISQATIEELAAVKGITRTTAENIHSFFAQKQ